MRRAELASCLVLAACCGELLAQSVTDLASRNLDRDAQRFAACVMWLDADCVYEMTHVELLVEAGVSTPYADLDALRQLWSEPSRADAETDGSGLTGLEEVTTERMTRFEALQPGEPFRAGDNLYAFVPFYQTNSHATGRLERTAFLVAISEDSGESWRFTIINGLHLQARHVAALYPDLAERSPPSIRNEFIPRPEPATSRYLRTTEGLFTIGEGAPASR